jgi:hypothetical protein
MGRLHQGIDAVSMPDLWDKRIPDNKPYQAINGRKSSISSAL